MHDRMAPMGMKKAMYCTSASLKVSTRLPASNWKAKQAGGEYGRRQEEGVEGEG